MNPIIMMMIMIMIMIMIMMMTVMMAFKVIEHYNTGNELPGAPSGQTKVNFDDDNDDDDDHGDDDDHDDDDDDDANDDCENSIYAGPGPRAHLCKGPVIEL